MFYAAKCFADVVAYVREKMTSPITWVLIASVSFSIAYLGELIRSI